MSSLSMLLKVGGHGCHCLQHMRWRLYRSFSPSRVLRSSQRVVTVTGKVVVGGKLCLVMSCVCIWS
jgi:hypothetical protein